MAVTVELFGKSYLVSTFTLGDLMIMRDHLRMRRRVQEYAAIPKLPPAELKVWMEQVDALCNQIDPIENFEQLAESLEGCAILYHGILRHQNPTITFDWVMDILNRAKEGDEAAILAGRNLRLALVNLLATKKNSPVNPQPITDPAVQPPLTT